MLFLIVPGVIPVVPGDEDEAGESVMNELPVAPLASQCAKKPGLFQIGNKLANLAWHMGESVTSAMKPPAFFRRIRSSRPLSSSCLAARARRGLFALAGDAIAVYAVKDRKEAYE